MGLARAVLGRNEYGSGAESNTTLVVNDPTRVRCMVRVHADTAVLGFSKVDRGRSPKIRPLNRMLMWNDRGCTQVFDRVYMEYN